MAWLKFMLITVKMANPSGEENNLFIKLDWNFLNEMVHLVWGKSLIFCEENAENILFSKQYLREHSIRWINYFGKDSFFYNFMTADCNDFSILWKSTKIFDNLRSKLSKYKKKLKKLFPIFAAFGKLSIHLFIYTFFECVHSIELTHFSRKIALFPIKAKDNSIICFAMRLYVAWTVITNPNT